MSTIARPRQSEPKPIIRPGMGVPPVEGSPPDCSFVVVLGAGVVGGTGGSWDTAVVVWTAVV